MPPAYQLPAAVREQTERLLQYDQFLLGDALQQTGRRWPSQPLIRAVRTAMRSGDPAGELAMVASRDLARMSQDYQDLAERVSVALSIGMGLVLCWLSNAINDLSVVGR